MAALGHTDAAKRVSDFTVLRWTEHGWDGYVGTWMSFSLAEGKSDGILYPTKRAAVTHVPDEFRYMYVKMHPGGMTPCEAEIMLMIHRSAYDAGFRLADPDSKTGGPDIIPRIGTQEAHTQIQALKRGKHLDGNCCTCPGKARRRTAEERAAAPGFPCRRVRNRHARH